MMSPRYRYGSASSSCWLETLTVGVRPVGKRGGSSLPLDPAGPSDAGQPSSIDNGVRGRGWR